VEDKSCDGEMEREAGVRRGVEAGSGFLSAERGSSEAERWAAGAFGQETDGDVVGCWSGSGRVDVSERRGGEVRC